MGVGGWADWGVGLCRDAIALFALSVHTRSVRPERNEVESKEVSCGDVVALKGQSFRPPSEGELLSLAWPRESSQREGHPTWRTGELEKQSNFPANSTK